MPAIVLDASATLSWLFSDEQTQASCELAHDVARHGAVVPSIWHAEITQLLLLAERRGCTTMERVTEIVALLDELPIETEADVPPRVRHPFLQGNQIVANPMVRFAA